ncbi:MAG: TonB-dependent receptor [Gemmatimonadota bacterium]
MNAQRFRRSVSHRFVPGSLATALAAAGVLWLTGLAAPSPAAAQATTGSLQGVARDSSGAAVATATIVARHLGTNFESSTLSAGNGLYRIAGLRPGRYEVTVTHSFFHEQSFQVDVGVGQSVTLNFTLAPSAVEVEEIRVVAERSSIGEETTTPEIATNITPTQIEELPQSDRNFLNFARLVPGVQAEGGSITSGAARDENINVFIDGASYKNDILQGGVVGQDASDGSPFPQNAVAGFRVITQQYKAEYQKATSAIISATTKTGTNEWQGHAFGLFTDEGLASQEFFSADRGDEETAFSRWQAGASLGGPIVRDRLFLFASYEGNIQDRLTVVNLGDGVPTFLRDFEDAPGVDIPADLSTLEGTFGVPFREHLFFGKLTWQPESRHTLDFSVNVRDEVRKGGFGGASTPQLREELFNNVTTVIGKHQWNVGDNQLNEIIVNYMKYRFHPVPLGTGVALEFRTWGNIGVRCCAQDIFQERFGIRDDFTWTVPDWGGLHVFKFGATLDFNEYGEIKELQENPTFIFQTQDSSFPEEAFFEVGDPEFTTDNLAFGIYAQDDWSLNDRLTLNLGVRWDVETNAKNNDFVTPQTVIDALSPLVDEQFEQRFFTDGDARSPYLGAIQPRLGFSYVAREDEGDQTVLFGGAGLYYDRTPFDWLLPEVFRQQRRRINFRFSDDGMPDAGGNPTIVWQDEFLSREGLLGLVESGQAPDPEVFLIDNDLTPPKAFQGSFGVRQTVDEYLFSLNYTMVRGWDDMVFWFFHHCPTEAANQAGCAPIDPPNFTNVLVSTQDTRHWYDAIYLKAQKRYSDQSPWGVQLAYTLGWARESPNIDGQFGGLCCLSPTEFEKTPSRNDERHRITFNWIVGLPWEIGFSGIGDFGSGLPFSLTDPTQFRPSGLSPLFCSDESTQGNCVPGTEREGRPTEGGAFPDKSLDVRLQKGFRWGTYGITVTAEVIDLFDWDHFTGYQGNVNNTDFLEPCCTDGETRRFQLGAEVAFGGP